MEAWLPTSLFSLFYNPTITKSEEQLLSVAVANLVAHLREYSYLLYYGAGSLPLSPMYNDSKMFQPGFKIGFEIRPTEIRQ